ncbi:MAG: hypothetical protein PUD22_05805 [Erysipelotrichaceae bacterium]|nr:hypothetical protein [Erysipelotrichaceae bacterium]
MAKKKIQIFILDDIYEKLKEESEKDDRTVSYIINKILEEKYKNNKQIENEKDIEEEKIETVVKEKIDYAAVVNMYNEICKSYPKVKSLSDSRKKAIKARLVKHTMEEIKEVFEKAEASDFMRGCNSKNWQASFDWMIMDRNMTKILDGNYDNRDAANTNKHPNRDSSYDGLNVFADDFKEW